MRIYLDVETYRPKKEDAFIKEKIISIGVLEDLTPYNKDSLNQIICPKFFTEWELESENKVITDFYNYLGDLLANKKPDFIVVVGFNILRMDIPLLIQKGVLFEIKSIEELNLLWHNMFVMDLFQVLLPANKYRFKGLRLNNVIKFIEKQLGCLNVPKVEDHSNEISLAYEKKKFNSILKWLKQDLYAVRFLDLSGFVTKLLEYSIASDKPLFG